MTTTYYTYDGSEWRETGETHTLERAIAIIEDAESTGGGVGICQATWMGGQELFELSGIGYNDDWWLDDELHDRVWYIDSEYIDEEVLVGIMAWDRDRARVMAASWEHDHWFD